MCLLLPFFCPASLSFWLDCASLRLLPFHKCQTLMLCFTSKWMLTSCWFSCPLFSNPTSWGLSSPHGRFTWFELQNVNHGNVERETEISRTPNLFIFFVTLRYHLSMCPVGFGSSTRLSLPWWVFMRTFYLDLNSNKKFTFWCCSWSCPPVCLLTPWPDTALYHQMLGWCSGLSPAY